MFFLFVRSFAVENTVLHGYDPEGTAQLPAFFQLESGGHTTPPLPIDVVLAQVLRTDL